MTKVGIIVPFFGKPDETQIRFLEWLGNPRTAQKFRALGIDKNDVDPTLGRPKDVLVDGLKFGKKVRKGAFIQRAVMHQKYLRDPDYYVCIDGEGIPFDNILKILEHLITLPVLGVLACRKNNLGLGNSNREIVERFELFILSKIFNTELFDGQCGCWGFRKRFLNASKLEGEFFEIELDFLIKLLMLGREIGFLPVDITRDPKDVPTFKSSDHKEKLEFICRILKRGKQEIEGFANAFEKEYGEKYGKLPSQYKKYINNLEYKPLGVRIICTGTCDFCPHKTT